jgi:ribosomally synthesized peptide (two-chain TOMM family)
MAGPGQGAGGMLGAGFGGVMFGSGMGGGVYAGGLGGGGSMSPAESPLAAFDQMIRWFHVWPQAVARAWGDPQFEQHLIQDTHLALHNAFGYQVPGGVLLKAERADIAHQWVATDIDPCMPGDWVSLPDIDLTMILPPRPKNETEGPVALGAYAETGRTYPFTMCCC